MGKATTLRLILKATTLRMVLTSSGDSSAHGRPRPCDRKVWVVVCVARAPEGTLLALYLA